MFAYEKRAHPVISSRAFLRRMAAHFGMVICLLVLSLAFGALGYRFIENLSWTDAFLNASMMISGMGPVSDHSTSAGKIFSSIYGLYCGLFLIAILGYLIAPILHRLMHKFYQPDEGQS